MDFQPSGIAPIPRYLQLFAPAALDLLNIYWGQKIYNKLIRAFRLGLIELISQSLFGKGLLQSTRCLGTSREPLMIYRSLTAQKA